VLRVARDRDPGPHPGHQCAQGAAGHHPGRAARAAAGPANRHPGGSRGRPGPRPDHQPTGGGPARAGYPRPPPPGPQPRDQGPDRRAGPAHRHRSPQAGGALRHRPRQRRRAAGRRRGQPQRLRSEACFGMLCGSSPIQASSGKTVRHRLNRGGDRQANAALYRIVLVRLRYHQPTKDDLTVGWPRASPRTKSSAVLLVEYPGAARLEPGRARGMCPGDGPAVWPPDGQFEFCRPRPRRTRRPASGSRPSRAAIRHRHQGSARRAATPPLGGRFDVCRLGLGKHHP
jgi:hypothetical protein